MDEDLRHHALDVIADLQDWLNKAHDAFQRKEQTEGTNYINQISDTSMALLNTLLQHSSTSPRR
jgi:hypothetical protein